MALNPSGPADKPVSLDELLKANKEKFDKIFASQRQQLGAAGIAADSLSSDATPSDTAPADAASSISPLSPASAPASTTIAPTPARLAETESAPPPEPRSEPIARTGDGRATITLDLVEFGLLNARQEMSAVMLRSAIAPLMGEQYGECAMITDAHGRMLVGQFGSNVAQLLEQRDFTLQAGDVILQSDPYLCAGAVSRINDWMVLTPIFYAEELVGFSVMSAYMADVGGSQPGGTASVASSIFAEGIRIPPVKLYAGAEPNKALLDLLMNNTRTAHINYNNLMAIIAACRAGAQRVVKICERFGKEVYQQACQALLERTGRAMRGLIVQNLSSEPQSFEDYIDDDGCGNGPFKLKLAVWREGEEAYFDWTGTSAQAQGPINFYLHEGVFKMFIGAYMFMAFDPQMCCNDGFHDLIHVKMPERSLLRPEFPAALGGGAHTLARHFDVLGGALGKKAPQLATAAGYGCSPRFFYSGLDNNGCAFQIMEIVSGGIAGRPGGDGMDGHCWWPLSENIPTEHLESSYPLLVERYGSLADSGGAGLHRGGNGVEKVYLLLAPGQVCIHDDRHSSQPWGIVGGRPGACSRKWLLKKNGGREALPAKVDNIEVQTGDRIIFRTAGGGGWGDPLERDADKVRNDVARRLVSKEAARDAYGVVLSDLSADKDSGVRVEIDSAATRALRADLKRSRKALPAYDFGGHSVT